MNKAIIGRKVGMTQIFTPEGKVIPVTVVEAGPCPVVQIKTVEKDGYAALMLSHEKNVAVDIEYVSDRVERIAGRFMRDDETATCTLSRLIHWCVKETVYKYFSGQNLGYHDIRLHAFRLSKEGSVIADNLRDSTESAVAYRVRDGYVLTYMFG